MSQTTPPAYNWVPFYNMIEPTLFGFPFFYWFQLVWIFASMIITAAVYFATEARSTLTVDRLK